MRYLIIGDIHENLTNLKDLETRFPADEYIAVGDYFDSWAGVTENTEKTIAWVCEKADNPRWTLLMGNHDVHYYCPQLRCDGFSAHRRRLIHGCENEKRQLIFPEDTWKKFKFYRLLEDGWVVSHAGIAHPGALCDPKDIWKNLDDINEYLTSYLHPFLWCGRARGGRCDVGGPLWLDWNREFVPVPGVNQIMGHTYGQRVRTKIIPGSKNYNIDTGGRYGLLLEDGKETTVDLARPEGCVKCRQK